MLGHWFIVASQNSMRVFTEVSGKKKFKLINTVENPLGRVRNRNLINRQAGMAIKTFGSTGAVRYLKTKEFDPHDAAATEFAQKIVKLLERSRQKKDFETLTIVAEPGFLGKIRSAMGPQLKNHVVKWVKKDLQKTPIIEIPKLLLPKKKKVFDFA